MLRFRPAAVDARSRLWHPPRPLDAVDWSSMRTGLLFAAVTIALVLAAALIPSPRRIHGTAVVRVLATSPITAEIDGVVRTIAVAPGSEVVAGEIVAHIEPDGAVERRSVAAEVAYRDAVRSMLRDSDDHSAALRVRDAATERRRSAADAAQGTVEASTSGVIASIRMRPGQRVTAGEVLCDVHTGAAGIDIAAVFPASVRPAVHGVTELRLAFAERREAVMAEVTGVSSAVMGPESLGGVTAPYVAKELPAHEAHFVVYARIDAAEIAAALPDFTIYDGMTATAQILVEDRSLLSRLLRIGGGQ